jgi:hypothetical protein
MGCCCDVGCSTNCDNTTDWNGRCCNWESFPAEMSTMFDGLVVSFGPTDIPVGTNRWRSEIINLPGSFLTSLRCEFSPQLALGSAFYLTGSATLGLSFGGFKLALHRTNFDNAGCIQGYNIWFGLSFSVTSVDALDAAVRNARAGGNIVWTSTNPSDLQLANGDSIVGHSVIKPCDGSNTSNNGGWGAFATLDFFGRPNEGLAIQDCNIDMGLRFGWAVPSSINTRLLPPFFISNPVEGLLSVPTWVGCGVRPLLSWNTQFNGVIGVAQDGPKLAMTVKRSTTWGQCANLPVNVNGQPNVGLQLSRGIQL